MGTDGFREGPPICQGGVQPPYRIHAECRGSPCTSPGSRRFHCEGSGSRCGLLRHVVRREANHYPNLIVTMAGEGNSALNLDPSLRRVRKKEDHLTDRISSLESTRAAWTKDKEGVVEGVTIGAGLTDYGHAQN